jgi:hypothetical protein
VDFQQFPHNLIAIVEFGYETSALQEQKYLKFIEMSLCAFREDLDVDYVLRYLRLASSCLAIRE